MKTRVFAIDYYTSSQTGWIRFRNSRTDKEVVYTNEQSALRQARRIRRHGTPNLFSGCGRLYPDLVQVTVMETSR